eukprot:NODE_1714_length_554_cov_271.902970_g1380_i0.p1 GENE.NODE_1714_length_554_cov_271.902970_g1380_i0~~NODE_1714_length_554_cov_271.902970_g1380_i0.p1  ORF type:complete len:115 (+),score=8.11 NODE_1714_length_554_cov_271.902970_g1380_i0:60-404(+)
MVMVRYDPELLASKGLRSFLDKHRGDIEQLNPCFNFIVRPFENHATEILAHYDTQDPDKVMRRYKVPFKTVEQIEDVFKEITAVGHGQLHAFPPSYPWRDIVTAHEDGSPLIST